MIHFTKQPYACSLSKNPIAFELFADNFSAETNIYPRIVLTFSRSEIQNERYFSFDFINPTTGLADQIKFLALINPEENGYHIPGGTATSNTLPTEEYMADVEFHMLLNDKLTTFYTLSRVDNVITLTAKEPIAELIPTNWYLSDTSAVSGVFSVNSVISSVFWKAQKRTDFRLNTQVYFESVYLSGHFDLVFEGTTTVDALGKVDLDVSGIIDAEIKNTFLTPPIHLEIDSSEANKARKSDVLRRYYIRVSEQWTNKQETTDWAKSDILLAHYGGVSMDDFATNHPVIHLQTTKAFLTAWPDKKRLADNQSDWLSWMNVMGFNETFQINLKVYFTDGTDESQQIGEIELRKWETLTIPVGYEQLAIENIQPTKEVHAWDVSIEFSGSPIVTRRMQRTQLMNVRNHTLVYLNNYGVQESFYSTGYWKHGYTSKKDVATQTLRHDYLSINGQDFVFQQISRNTFTVRTGSLRSNEAEALQDVLNTAPVFLYQNQRFMPIIIEQGNFEPVDESEILQTIEMKVTKSMALKNYSNQEDLPTIEVIEECGIVAIQVVHHKSIEYGLLLVYDEIALIDSITLNDNGRYELSTPLIDSGTYRFRAGVTLDGDFMHVTKIVDYQENEFSFQTPFYTSSGINDTFQIKTDGAIKLNVDWDKNETINAYTIANDTLTSISEDSNFHRGRRTIVCSTACSDRINQFTIQGKAYRNFKLNKLTKLRRLEIINCALPGHFSVAPFKDLVYCYLNGNQLTSFEVGINMDLYIVDLQNNLLDNAAVLNLCRSLYQYRKVLDFIVFFLQGNPDEGNYTQEVLDIANGTGAYTGDGLIQNNIQLIL
jgi:hypothetical protein